MMNLMSPSGLFISLMGSLAALPFFLFTLPAGVLADVLDKGRILRLTNLWLAGSAAGLAILGWAGMLNPMLLLGGVFLLGAGFAINAPAWASVVPQIVSDGELPSASALNGVQMNISGILGPALAGILLARVGAPVIFGLNAVGFFLAFTAVPRFQKTSSDLKQTFASFTHSVSSAFSYIRQTRTVQNILCRSAIFSSFVAVVPALTPVLLLKELHLDGSSLGLVFASMGVGSVVSAILILLWLRSRFSSQVLIMIAQVALASIYLLMATVHHCVYCLIPMALAGASWTLAGSELWVLAQRAFLNSVRGRLSAIMMIISQGAMALGGIVWGLSGQIAGTQPALAGAAFLFLTITVGQLLFRSSPDLLALRGKDGAVPLSPI
jgi:MFS family permease